MDKNIRFKQLKSERNKWWADVVPRDVLDVSKKTTAPAFHLNKDGTIIKVFVWIDYDRFKRVSFLTGAKKHHVLTVSRTWPTEEGAMFDKWHRTLKHFRKLEKEYLRANADVVRVSSDLTAYLEGPI